MNEDAILRWIITSGLPILTFIIACIWKSRDAEHRLTNIESNQTHLEAKVEDIEARLLITEQNHKILHEIKVSQDYMKEKIDNLEAKMDRASK